MMYSYLNNGLDFPSFVAMSEVWNPSPEHTGKVSKTFVPRINAVNITWHLETRRNEKSAKSGYGADCMRVE